MVELQLGLDPALKFIFLFLSMFAQVTLDVIQLKYLNLAIQLPLKQTPISDQLTSTKGPTNSTNGSFINQFPIQGNACTSQN